MKIAFVLYKNLQREDGVTKKVRTQIRWWRRQHEVRAFAFMRRSEWSSAVAVDGEVELFESFSERRKAASAIAQSVAAWGPDAIYYRYNPPYGKIASLFGRFPTVVELNADDLREFRLGGRLRAWHNRLTRGQIYGAATGLVSITREIAQLPHVARFDKPTLVIGNSIDLADFEVLPAAPPGRPKLAFMASDRAPWHGVDKILRLARLLPELDFELIGAEDDWFEGDPPQNVRVCGFLGADRYGATLAGCHAAVSGLAQHRKGMRENPSLKVREYLARGLPVILGHGDPDLPAEAPWLLRIPNTEDNVETHAQQIREFVRSVMSLRVSQEDIRPLIDASVKEPERLHFIETCAQS